VHVLFLINLPTPSLSLRQYQTKGYLKFPIPFRQSIRLKISFSVFAPLGTVEHSEKCCPSLCPVPQWKVVNKGETISPDSSAVPFPLRYTLNVLQKHFSIDFDRESP